METVLAFLVLIGVLVWFHELGHFLFAKLFGVKVEIFSIGFGPVLVSKKLGETEYRISLIPLGGFVKLYGEEENIKDPQAFSSKPHWQKILIAFGGPLFNFILAVFLFSFVFMVGREVPFYVLQEPVVGHIIKDSPAQKLGIREGDLIKEVNGKEVKNWKDLEKVIFENLFKKEWEIKVLREGKEVLLSGKLELTKTGAFGVEPKIEPIVGRVLPGSPAEQVGIKTGDRIVEINGIKVNTWYDVVELIRNSQGAIEVKLQRGNEVITKTVIPQRDQKTGMPIMGISPKIETVKIKEPVSKAFLEGIDKTKELSALTLKAVWGLITGGISVKTLGGPIAIAQLAGESAQAGVVAFLSMMAFISVQLAIFNLLPLPVLDGGLILLFLIEAIRRKPLPEKFKENWQRIGFALIIALSIFVILNDLIRLITGNKF